MRIREILDSADKLDTFDILKNRHVYTLDEYYDIVENIS